MLAALTLALVALLALVAPAAAKEGAEAQLDAPISLDAEPGSTIEVAVGVFMVDPSGRYPVQGSPIFVRLVPPNGGEPMEDRATETPAGSGHYVAAVVVPAGGIAEVVVGMPGESCDAAGCRRSDILFPLTDDPLVRRTFASAAPLPAQPAPARQPAATTASSTAAGPDLPPIVLAGVGILAVLAIAGLIARRRSGPLGGGESGSSPI
jgi:MYXO-CTERM domain-containing protein